MSHFNLLGAAPEPRVLAQWHNRLQELAAGTRLGIPVTLSTDPRHAFTDNVGTAARSGAFSEWPESLGLAAIGDPDLVGEFADIARQEMYRIPQHGDPLEEVVLNPLDGGRHTLGPGRYETLVEVGTCDALPLLTFTSPHGADHVEHSQPAPAYLAMLGDGLRESRGWDEQQVTAYFDSVLPR